MPKQRGSAQIREKAGAAPVFVHSSFRTGSTWFWSKLRADPTALAYGEFFHEQLATLKLADFDSLHPGSWESGHSATAPYFMEFLPLIRGASGVALYQASMALESFVPRGGSGGALSKAEKAYVAGLIAFAHRAERIPVLTCTRTLGRAGSLKRGFGGTHILLKRNLLHQWHSYAKQRRIGNPYFVRTVLTTIDRNAHDPFIGWMRGTLAARYGAHANLWLRDIGEDDLFAIFLGLHVYLMMQAFTVADLVVDINRLGRGDRLYRRRLEGTIAAATHVKVDLSDARETIEFPLQPIEDLARTQALTEAFVARAMMHAEDAQARRFGATLLAETWGAQEVFARHTSALYRLYQDKVVRVAEENAALKARAAEQKREIEALRLAGDEPKTVRKPAAKRARKPTNPSSRRIGIQSRSD